METLMSWPWVGLLLLGALHGVNPGMGWLFAVALGLQEEDRRAVWGALGPLALGHLLAVAVALAVAAALGLVVPASVLRWAVAAALVGMGILQLSRHLHPRRGGMRVGAKDLVIWSFMMASAHGAGLMALPFALAAGRRAGEGDPSGAAAAGGGHAAHGLPAEPLAASLGSAELAGVLATLVHTVGYLAVMGAVAVVVYEKLGLRLLRSAWINLDLVWAAALIVTGVLTATW
jgi:hypothetical protein